MGSKKSWFNVYFYPQNGGSYAQSSGYIYNSGFTKTGKLWWDEGFGGDGAIYSSIDGSGDAYPIGECDNASRVIKYVVLLEYRHSHYNLVDMRIHDINVVADLNRHNPNAPNPDDPVEHDGTIHGNTEEDVPDIDGMTVEAVWADVMLAVVPYWILKWNWWPVIVYPICVTRASFVIDIRIGADLLNAKYVESFNMPGVDPDDYGGQSDSYLDENIDMIVMGLLCAGIIALNPLLIAAEGLVRSGVGNLTPVQWGIIIAAILVAFSVVFFSTLYIESSLNEGRMDHGSAAVRYQVLLTAILFSVLGLATLLYVHNRFVSILNEQIKAAAGEHTGKLIKGGLASKHLALMLIVMIYLAIYFVFMFLYHLVLHYSS